MNNQKSVHNLDVTRAHFGYEVKRRAPWLLLSVAAGIVMIWIGQTYEEILSQKIQLVFFIPVIVYLSDSIGSETLALFVRELALKRLNLKHIFLKELFVGLFLGFASGIPMGLFSYFWFQDFALSVTVASAMIINGIIAVLIGVFLPVIFSKLKKDPALGTEEIATALSDNLSILVYLVITTMILFGF
jgi:magnesium transporter